MMNLISLENIAVSHGEGSFRKPVFENLAINITKGECVHIVCKNLERRGLISSLLKGNLPKNFEITGNVRVNGRLCQQGAINTTWPALKVGIAALRKATLKSSQPLVEQFLGALMKDRLIPRSQAFGIIANGLAKLGLDDQLLNSYPHELTPVDRAKAQIVSEILQNPQVLIIDGLEVISSFERQELMKNLDNLRNEQGLALVLWHNNNEQKPAGGKTYYLDEQVPAMLHQAESPMAGDSFLWT